MINNLIHKEKMDWKGMAHELELYESDNISSLDNISQAQAVPFTDKDHIVIYKHIDGYYGLPGGHVEEGEDIVDTLKREILEECACEVIDHGLIGYIKDTQLTDGKIRYQARYWAKVKPLDQPVNDPAGKALSREIIKIDGANKILKWGERGEKILQLAIKKFK